MRKHNLALMLITLVLLGSSALSGQTVKLYLENDKTIHRCRIQSVSEIDLRIVQPSMIPFAQEGRVFALKDVVAIREVSRANKYAPYCLVLGSYIGMKYFFRERDPIEGMTLSERFATMLDTPVNFLTSVTAGGAVGYLAGHFLLGGNRELIIIHDESEQEKRQILTAYIDNETGG